MDDLPIFLQMFVRVFAFFALSAWLQTLAPSKAEKPADPERACPAKIVAHTPLDHAAKVCPAPESPDPK